MLEIGVSNNKALFAEWVEEIVFPSWQHSEVKNDQS
jgi:hypothetical protein